MGRRVSYILAFTVLCISEPLFSQVTVLQVISGSAGDPRIQSIVSRTTSIELERAGLTPVIPRNDLTANPSEDIAVSAARRAEAQYLLFIHSGISGDSLYLEMSLTRVRDRKRIGADNRTLPIDINLDNTLAFAIRSFLEDKSIVAEVRAAQEANPGKGGPVPAEAPPVPVPKISGPGRVESLPRSTEEKSSAGFSFDAGVAPLLLVGTASDYFRYGLAFGLSFGYSFPVFGLAAAVGVDAGAIRIFPIPELPQGTVYAFSAGPSLQLGTPARAKVSLMLRVTPAASVLTVQLPNGPLLAKTIPSIESDLAARLRVAPAWVVGMRLGFIAIFEPRYPIMGFMPAVFVGFEP